MSLEEEKEYYVLHSSKGEKCDNADFLELVMEGEKSLKKLYTNSMACEEKAFSAMRGMVETWQYQADFTQMIR